MTMAQPWIFSMGTSDTVLNACTKIHFNRKRPLCSPLLTSSFLMSSIDICSAHNLFLSPKNPLLPFQKHPIHIQFSCSRFHTYRHPIIISPYTRVAVSVSASASASASAASAMATGTVKEVLPPALDSTSEAPPIFDGTTRLYISYTCPYAQRVWITRNCKGLQDKIKLVPIDLQNRPDWYKEKVYPPNKVPSLEHNNEVKGESLDLIKYVDTNFEGPPLFPDDPAKKEFAEELLSYTDSFNRSVITSFKVDGIDDTAAAFDYIETALSKFEEGPFFLGQFSLVDIAYAPFIERFQPYLLDVKKYDVRVSRPKLAAWIEEIYKNENYGQTRRDPKELVETYKKRFLPHL